MTPLEFQIKTVADLQGVNVTADALQKMKERTQQLSSTIEKNTGEYKGATAEMKEQAAEAVRLIEKKEQTKRATESLTGSLQSMRLAGKGVSDMMRGLSSGDLMQAFRGFTDVRRAVEEASGQLKNLFSQAGRGAATGAAIAAPVLVALEIVKQKTKEMEDEMNRVWDRAAKNREERTREIEALTARNIAAFEKEKQAVEDLAKAYAESAKRTTDAYGRDDRLGAAKRERRDKELDLAEAKALSAAKTPEQREKIQKEFAAQRRSNSVKDTAQGFAATDRQADIQIDKAQQQITSQNQLAREAQNKIDAAQKEFDLAQDATRRYAPTDNGINAQEARNRAKVAKENLEQTKAGQGKIIDQSTAAINAAQATIDEAKIIKEETADRRAAYKAMIQKQAVERGSATPEAKAQNAADAKNASSEDYKTGVRQADPGATPKLVVDGAKPSSGGTISRGGKSIQVDSPETVQQLAKAGAVLGKVLDSVEGHANFISSRASKTERTLKNLKETKAGS